MPLDFNEENVRAIGRATRGVKGITLGVEDELAGILKVIENNYILVITEKGLGKRIEYSNFTPHGKVPGVRSYTRPMKEQEN